MRPHLDCWLAGQHQVRLLEGSRFTVGRQASNDLALPDDAEVSRVHAVIEPAGLVWVIRDLSSRNGTRVNGELIAADRPLADGDELLIGSTLVVFRGPEIQDALAPTRGAAAPPKLTPRERDVLVALFQPTMKPGMFSEPASTRAVAAALVISDAAVKQHLGNLYEKFGIAAELDRRRLRLANEALRRGAVTLAEVRAWHGRPAPGER